MSADQRNTRTVPRQQGDYHRPSGLHPAHMPRSRRPHEISQAGRDSRAILKLTRPVTIGTAHVEAEEEVRVALGAPDATRTHVEVLPIGLAALGHGKGTSNRKTVANTVDIAQLRPWRRRERHADRFSAVPLGSTSGEETRADPMPWKRGQCKCNVGTRAAPDCREKEHLTTIRALPVNGHANGRTSQQRQR